MGNLIRNAIGVLLIPLAAAFAYEAFLFLTANLASLVTNWIVFGILAYLIVYLVVPRRTTTFIETLEHELAHTIAAYAFFQHVSALRVEINGLNGGRVESPSEFNVVARLAPYFLPLCTLPLLIVKPFIFPSVHKVIDFLIGFTLAFHVFGLIAEYKPNKQTDLKKSGQIFAFVVTVLLNAVFLVIILSVVLNNYSYIPTYLESSIARTREVYQFVIDELRRRGLLPS